MGLSSKRILSVAMAAALALPAAPAFAAEPCSKKGGEWRSAGNEAASQTFRLEARNRSSADVQGRLGGLADDWVYHDLDRSYTRIMRAKHSRADLVDGRQTHDDMFVFITEGGEILGTCIYEYQVRNKTRTQQSRSRTAAEIKYGSATCTAAANYKVSCERNYSPDNRRLRVSITLQDK